MEVHNSFTIQVYLGRRLDLKTEDIVGVGRYEVIVNGS
jgi:hypothetical protein